MLNEKAIQNFDVVVNGERLIGVIIFVVGREC